MILWTTLAMYGGTRRSPCEKAGSVNEANGNGDEGEGVRWKKKTYQVRTKSRSK